ncbi:sensor histidine kinase [Actinomadura scrupuli]|uniref:sensor histidine kinase n=1 Tax=Actinomadura scrupuli TaxID=559629 RepID=UPI003D95142F
MGSRYRHASVIRAYRRPVVDAVVALAAAAATVSSDAGVGEKFGSLGAVYLGGDPPPWSAVLLGLLVGALAWWRRRRPGLFVLGAMVVCAALSAYVPVVLAQYTIAERTTSWRKVIATLPLGAVVVGIPIWRLGGTDAPVPPILGICVAPALLGLYVGTRRDLVAGIRERAERAEREQHQRILGARSDERAQIARDMHDVVTHRVSLMVLHATALEAAQGHDAAAIGSRIGAIGREALGELRALLEVLRAEGDGGAPLAPQPGLADLEDLVADSRRLGMPVTLEMADESGAWTPALVEHAVYRVVQEALTNVHKHAGGAQTRVRIRRTPQALRLSVANGGGHRGGHPRLPDGGHGLLGIAERIRLVGGELTARPTTGGGFEILAEVPLKPERAR